MGMEMPRYMNWYMAGRRNAGKARSRGYPVRTHHARHYSCFQFEAMSEAPGKRHTDTHLPLSDTNGSRRCALVFVACIFISAERADRERWTMVFDGAMARREEGKKSAYMRRV